MKYYDLDLSIGSQTTDHHTVWARSESMGEAQSKLLSTDIDQIRADLTHLSGAEFDDASLKKFGQSLFSSLFSGEIGILYQRALGQVYADDNAGVRIRLRIEPPDLAALPWEYLYEPSRDCFLATSSETLLTRYIELSKPIRDLQTALPIRILVVIPEVSGLDVEPEKRTIIQALSGLQEAVEIRVLEGNVTSAKISDELVLKQFHILHFIGHGGFDNDQGCLVLNSEQEGTNDFITAKEFAFNFQDYPSMKLVVLNSCSGAQSSAHVLTGVAHELVSMGVPAVIAMRQEITDEAAKIFARDFYFKLCRGYERGRVDIAVSHARRRLIAELADSDEFTNPVLFMRSPQGVIFDLVDGAPITTVRELHTDKAVTHTIDFNISQIEKEGGAGAAAGIAKEVEAQSRVRSRATNFYKKIALASVSRVAIMLLLMAAVLFVASQTRVLNAFRVDDYFGGVMRLWSSTTDNTLRQDIRIILAKPGANGELGNPVDNPAFRAHHAELIRRLAELKPKAIVFDVIFNAPASDVDPAFRDAILFAQSKGVPVIGSQQIDINGLTRPDTLIADDLKSAFGNNWGDVEVGVPLDLPLLSSSSYINAYEIATLKTASPNTNGELEVEPSLALRVVMQTVADAGTQPRVFFDVRSNQVVLDAIAAGSSVRKAIPVMKNGRLLDMVLEYVDRADLEHATSEYQRVYDLTKSSQQQEKDYLARTFKDAIIFIAYDTPKDRYADIESVPRVGVAFHANATSNILNGSYISQISRVVNFFIIVLMIAIGILLQTVVRKRWHHSLPLALPWVRNIVGDIRIPVGLLVVLVLYFLGAYFVYSRLRVSFDMSYHVAALLFGYWLIAIFRNRLRLAGGAGEESHAHQLPS
jgi:hypothetical protein